MTSVNDNFKFPRGKAFAPFFSQFLRKHDISDKDIARKLECSVYTIQRIKTGKSEPTERCYAEINVAYVLTEGKGWRYYKQLSKEKTDEMVKAVLAGGTSALTVGGMVALISSLGVVSGLSAAGITSGLAAIGAIVGGGMIAGVCAVAAAPIAAGLLVWNVLSGSGDESYLYEYEHSLNFLLEKNPTWK